MGYSKYYNIVKKRIWKNLNKRQKRLLRGTVKKVYNRIVENGQDPSRYDWRSMFENFQDYESQSSFIAFLERRYHIPKSMPRIRGKRGRKAKTHTKRGAKIFKLDEESKSYLDYLKDMGFLKRGKKRKGKRGKTIKRAKYQTSSRRMTEKGLEQDAKIKALKPGKRKSRRGKIYYEYRRNRSDLKHGV